MKKTIVIICILASLIGLVSCSTVTEINVSDEAAIYRDYVFAKNDIIGKTEEELKASYEANTLPVISARTEQVFPEVDTKNKLEKFSTTLGDYYTLSGDNEEDCIVFYIHGGAWVWEIDPFHVEFCDLLVDKINAKVYMPIYPLAPQASNREGYEMVEQVYDLLLKEDKPIYIMGDSAGGTITLGFVLDLKDRGKRMPDKVVVMAPCADATFSNPDIAEFQKKDGMLPRYECLACAKLWADGEDLRKPKFSPLFGDFKNFPDTLMFVEDCDILCPDELLLYEKMKKQGVKASLVMGKGLWHVFPIFDFPEREQSLEIIKKFCN